MPLYRVVNDQRRLQVFRTTELRSRYQEQDLENWIEQNPQVLLQDEPMLVIGRQVNTPVGVIDLLGIDSSGAGVIIELKRAPSQREAIAQALEYVSWLSAVDLAELRGIAEVYLRRKHSSLTLDEAWQETFGSEPKEATLNQQQRLFVVIEGEDERISAVAQFLRTSGVDITLIGYSFYQTESGEEILSIDVEVGAAEDTATAESRPSESALLRTWDAATVEVYKAFKAVLLSGGLFLKPLKSGMSFIKQTPETPVFICFFNPSGSQVGVWLRSDSLSALFDFNSVAETLKTKLPRHARVKHTPTWFIMTLAPSATDAQAIARLLLTEVVSKLD